jgi:hypothetical protein
MLKFLLVNLVLCIPSLSFAQSNIIFEKPIFKTLYHSSKKVSLMQVKMSKALIQTLENNASHAIKMQDAPKNPASVQLGMNNIPVADQGMHGSCVTFAITQAISAIKGKPYSELCTLSLGQYLENNGYKKSGWNGQMVRNVLSRMDDFGIVTLEIQKSLGCGAMFEYPLEAIESEPTNLEDFNKISQSLHQTGLLGWSNYFDVNQWIHQSIPSEQMLNLTKEALNRHNRVIISVLLPIFLENFGAVGEYHTSHDTWLANEELVEAVQYIHETFWLWGGHAMIITGYDDQAIIYDAKGKAHQGVFTLRNSWGNEAGKHGDYYMTYDYFKLLAVELNELASK